jgi:Tol biopolymer transport system component
MKGRSAISLLAASALLTTMMIGSAQPAGAAFSGANARVAFTSDRDGDREIYSMRADGTGVIQLTVNTSQDYDPAFSADGSKIAFITDRDGTTELYTMNADGTSPRRVTTNSLIESHPSWAPPGTLIAFAALNGSDSDIYEIKPDGTNQVDLTPDPVAIDVRPAWSPGGMTIAFDSTNRGGNPGPDIYTMDKDGSNIVQLTTTHVDTNPSWSPDNKNIVFESARDSSTGPSVFATVTLPNGLVAVADGLLVTQFKSDKVLKVASSGATSTFATLPPTGNAPVERYLAVSPGLGGFSAGYVYVTVGPNIYKITPDGSTVTLFVNIPSLPNGETSITFDAVGTFGYNMILTDRRGPVYSVNSAGVVNNGGAPIGDFGHQIEGPLVLPLTFAPFGGQLVGGSEFSDSVYAMTNAIPGVVSVMANAESPESEAIVPSTVCNLGASGGAFFFAMKDMNQIWKFPAGDFAGLSGSAMVPSELATSIATMASSGGTITVGSFYGPIGTPDLEGSAFAICPSGPLAPSVPGNAGDPREIYRMSSSGLSQSRLTSNTTDDTNPAWSPDNLSIVFQSDRDDPAQPTCEPTLTCKYEVYKMNASDGSAQTNISNKVTADDTSPDWEAVSYYVSVVDFAFNPSIAKPKLGGAVYFDFVGPTAHTVTDNSGMGLFDSLTKTAGTFFLVRFTAAGKYPYICTLHPTLMTGEVRVPMTAVPKTGGVTTVFTLTWAVAAPPGYLLDVQIKRPNSSVFVDWLPGTTLKSSTFTPDAGVGTYSFQSRLRNTTNGFASNYSVPVSITVS